MSQAKFLIFANKQDLPGALTSQEVAARLRLFDELEDRFAKSTKRRTCWSTEPPREGRERMTSQIASDKSGTQIRSHVPKMTKIGVDHPSCLSPATPQRRCSKKGTRKKIEFESRWFVQASIGTTGHGLFDGLCWIASRSEPSRRRILCSFSHSPRLESLVSDRLNSFPLQKSKSLPFIVLNSSESYSIYSTQQTIVEEERS